jgi:hypothetical protein
MFLGRAAYVMPKLALRPVREYAENKLGCVRIYWVGCLLIAETDGAQHYDFRR